MVGIAIEQDTLAVTEDSARRAITFAAEAGGTCRADFATSATVRIIFADGNTCTGATALAWAGAATDTVGTGFVGVTIGICGTFGHTEGLVTDICATVFAASTAMFVVCCRIDTGTITQDLSCGAALTLTSFASLVAPTCVATGSTVGVVGLEVDTSATTVTLTGRALALTLASFALFCGGTLGATGAAVGGVCVWIDALAATVEFTGSTETLTFASFALLAIGTFVRTSTTVGDVGLGIDTAAITSHFAIGTVEGAGTCLTGLAFFALGVTSATVVAVRLKVDTGTKAADLRIRST